MDDRDKTVTIRCFNTCTYDLYFPAFFVEASKATLRKILKWLFRFDWYPENEETIRFLDRELPRLQEWVEARNKARIEAAEKKLMERKAEYDLLFESLDQATFPADWSKKRKTEERKARRDRNAQRMIPVKDAKADCERAKKKAAKDLEHAKEVFAIYQDAKKQ